MSAQENSEWKIEAEIWAIRQGVDGEVLYWIGERAKSEKEFYDLCHKELQRSPKCDYTEEDLERICSIMENHNFESQIKETSKLMREWYESLKGRIELVFFKNGEVRASFEATNYDPDIVDQLKNLHYFYSKRPAWNPQKKQWEIEIDLLPKVIFAFPGFELSPSLLSRFPSVKEIQENGTRAIAYIDSIIQEYAGLKYLSKYHFQYDEDTKKNYDTAKRIVLGNQACYREAVPKVKELAWKMGFSDSNWKKPK